MKYIFDQVTQGPYSFPARTVMMKETCLVNFMYVYWTQKPRWRNEVSTAILPSVVNSSINSYSWWEIVSLALCNLEQPTQLSEEPREEGTYSTVGPGAIYSC